MGFWGIAGIAYYRISSEWAGREFPTRLVEAAIARCADGEAISRELSTIEAVLAELPKIEKTNEMFTDTMQLQILEVITRLFSAKTGLDCE